MNDSRPADHTTNASDFRQYARSLKRQFQVFTPTLERLPLADVLQGRAAFLVVNGPSLNAFDLTRLQRRGVVTMGLNNGPAVFKPNYWVAVDPPGRFVEQVWKDPTITKFAPLANIGERPRVRNEDGTLRLSSYSLAEQPATFFYERNNHYNAATFLTEPTFNWGSWEQYVDAHNMPGGRSVFLVALKLLYWLGANPVYILGADFRMAQGVANYAFDQDRTKAAVDSNNNMYAKTNERLKLARPYFDQAGYKVLNCTPDSGLTAFDFIDYDQATDQAAAECGKPIVTEGMYD